MRPNELRVPLSNLPSAVALHLEEQMCSGRLEPGDLVPEVEVAKELSISRTPVREALRILEAQGVLSAVRGRGFVVRGLTLSQLDHLYDLRALLEPHAAALAAEVAHSDTIWNLGELLARAAPARLREGGGGNGFSPADAAAQNIGFHKAIASASGNEFLASFVGQLTARPLKHRAMYWYTASERARVHQEHRRIFEAIKRRAASEASELMLEHTTRTARFMHETLLQHPEVLERE